MGTQRFSNILEKVTFLRVQFSTNLTKLLQIPRSMDNKRMLIEQTNLYLQQNDRNFHNSAAKMKAFIGANYMMTLNQLSSIQIYLDCDCNVGIVGKAGLQNIFTRTIYKENLKNLHFADSTKQDKTDKRLKDWTNNL